MPIKQRRYTLEPKANLFGIDLRGADLRDVNLYDADLQGANLRGKNIWRGDFRGANLRGADLREVYAVQADFLNADMTTTNIEGMIIDDNEGNTFELKQKGKKNYSFCYSHPHYSCSCPHRQENADGIRIPW